MLELRGVTKHFGDTIALQPTDLIAASGSTMVLIGPSGCGKSTLLRLMLGLIEPDKGSVAIDGTILGEQNLDTLRHRIGYVIQDGGLFPHLRAGENVGLLARHLAWTPDRIHTRLRELAELTHFPVDALGRYPAQLSGGQRQRVGLMRALMLEPDLLLLDEPLGALDPIVRSDLQNDLREIFRGLGKTVVMVTHDMGEAGFFGDQIALMREGRIVQQGTLTDLLTKPAEGFVDRFINAQRTTLHVLGGAS